MANRWKTLTDRLPVGSIYGILTYIWLIFMVKVGKYASPTDPVDYVIVSFSLN